MKKIKRRAYAIFLLVFVIPVLLTVFLFGLAADGGDWAAFPTNQNVFTGGQISLGTVSDRNGVMLMESEGGTVRFHESADVRRATFHVLGDRGGNVATGVTRVYADRLIGYNLVTGTYSIGGTGGRIGLTIDAELSRVAHAALAGRQGAVVVMNYETGEILAAVSNPSYDPLNRPEIREDDLNFEGVYINRAFSSAFTPGSAFKVVTAAAALDTFDDALSRTYSCNGGFVVTGNNVRCTGNHGTIGLEEAMRVSCNPYFAQLALDLGGNRLLSYVEQFGLNQSLNLEGVPIAAGNFAAAEGGTPALAWSGVGQSENLMNPLAMARFMGAIARGGAPMEPRLLEYYAGGIIPRRYESEAEAPIMSGAVASHLGWILRSAAPQASFPGLNVAGKTGTAEVADRQPHAWFVGFLDEPDHPLAFVVIVEHGGGGLAQAVPVANTVLQAAVRE